MSKRESFTKTANLVAAKILCTNKEKYKWKKQLKFRKKI